MHDVRPEALAIMMGIFQKRRKEMRMVYLLFTILTWKLAVTG